MDQKKFEEIMLRWGTIGLIPLTTYAALSMTYIALYPNKPVEELVRMALYDSIAGLALIGALSLIARRISQIFIIEIEPEVKKDVPNI